MYPFSPIALQQLHDAGWTEDRRIDISDYERKVQELGFEPFPCVQEFLQCFGDLVIGRPAVRQDEPSAPDVIGLGTPRPIVIRPPFRRNVVDMEIWTAPSIISNIHASHLVSTVAVSITPQLYFADWCMPEVECYRMYMDPAGIVNMREKTGEGLCRIAISGQDAIEALLTDRPAISGEGLSGENRFVLDWEQYVERTGIVPPDEVIALLIPEAQDAIQRAAASLPHHGNDA
jgi:hypothetical protein